MIQSKCPRSNPCTERCPCKDIRINLFIHYLVLSLPVSGFGKEKKKSQFSRKHPPPCPINLLLFPQATSTQKERANQVQIILWEAARREMGDGISSCWNPAPPPALNICASCWQASKQINGARPQASLASQASSVTPQSQRLIPPSHQAATLRLGSSLIRGYVIPRNRRLCSRMESQRGNMLAFRKTMHCEKEGLGGNNVGVSSASWKQSQLLAAQWHAGRSIENFSVTADPACQAQRHLDIRMAFTA